MNPSTRQRRRFLNRGFIIPLPSSFPSDLGCDLMNPSARQRRRFLNRGFIIPRPSSFPFRFGCDSMNPSTRQRRRFPDRGFIIPQTYSLLQGDCRMFTKLPQTVNHRHKTAETDFPFPRTLPCNIKAPGICPGACFMLKNESRLFPTL